MDSTKTLLQQIREKEQDVNKTIDAVRQESEGVIASARTEAQKILSEGDLRGNHAAEELTQKERESAVAEVAQLKKNTTAEIEWITKTGEKNRNTAVEAIVSHVTMR